VLVGLLVVGLGAAGWSSWSSTRAGASDPPITKVLWIWEENSNPAKILGSCATCQQLPYLNSVAMTYGRATNVQNASLPSLPNYIAVTSGSTQGIADDAAPPKHPLSVPSLFDQLPLGQAKVFAETMTSNCQATDGPKGDVDGAGFYLVRHTAWPYYTTSRSACAANQVPMAGNLQTAIDNGLPRFSALVPAVCNDFHKGGSPDVCVLGPGETYNSRADEWLEAHISQIMAGPDWQAGRLAIFVVWDEGAAGAGPGNGTDCTTSTDPTCKIPLVVLSPRTHSVVDATAYTTYSVLRSTEELLGLPLLGRAATAQSFVASFGLGVGSSPPVSTTTATSSTTPTSTTATSTTVATSVPDSTPPSGSIVAPADGAVVHGSLVVSVSASDNVGVAKINLLVDGAYRLTVKKVPYNFVVDTTQYADGPHTLSAKIYDAANNMTTTAPVRITIDN
jgi:acid phosphatase